MKRILLATAALLLTTAAQMPPQAAAPAPQKTMPPLVTETPKAFVENTNAFDYIKRTAMIPMRDGTKLHTVIIIPRGANNAPILLSRTPYGAEERFPTGTTSHLAAVMADHDVADDLVEHHNYIRVIQDVRGKHGSEGDYAMTRPAPRPVEQHRE